jgi:hypothetical protein
MSSRSFSKQSSVTSLRISVPICLSGPDRSAWQIDASTLFWNCARKSEWRTPGNATLVVPPFGHAFASCEIEPSFTTVKFCGSPTMPATTISRASALSDLT